MQRTNRAVNLFRMNFFFFNTTTTTITTAAAESPLGPGSQRVPAPTQNQPQANLSRSMSLQPCDCDQPRDQPSKCLCYARSFWLYLQNHCRLRNGSLMCVSCAYTRHLTIPLVWPLGRKKSGSRCACTMAIAMRGFMRG
jgi:hypothetical protein